MSFRKFAAGLWKLVSGDLFTDRDVVVDGVIDLTTNLGNQIKLNVANSPTVPPIQFGSGQHGIYSPSAGTINMAFYGVERYNINNTYIQSATTSGFYLARAASSAAFPAFAFKGDENCGLGRYGADCPTLCGGNSELLRAVYSGTWAGIYCRPMIVQEAGVMGSNPTADTNVIIQAKKTSGEPKIEAASATGSTRKAVSMSYRYSDNHAVIAGYDYNATAAIPMLISAAALDMDCSSLDLDSSGAITIDGTTVDITGSGDVNVVSGDEVTITATTKITLDAPDIEFGAGESLHKTLTIDTWDMNTDASAGVTHGLDVTQITGVSAMIKDDNSSPQYFWSFEHDGTIRVDSTSIALTRDTGGKFDSTDFNSTLVTPRAKIVVHYDPTL